MMVDRIPTTGQNAAVGFLALLRLTALSAARSTAAPVASTSYHTFASSTQHISNQLPSPHLHHQLNNTRGFASSSTASVSAHRKQAGREKARLRNLRSEEKALRRRQKDSLSPSLAPTTSERRGVPRDPLAQDVEDNIREYMARTGPRGERLTRAQQERLLKHELRGLGEQLEKLEKKATSDEATQNLPELDDQTLEEIYQALMLPPPPTEEEARLARLEGGRRERGLLRWAEEERGRGRKALGLPDTKAEERRMRMGMDLKQRMIDAREKGRMLLPPSKSPVQPVTPAEEASEGEGLADEIDLAALPYAERQELRLQQLFARLALVHGSPELGSTSETSDSLQEIKSNLANRIANILREHDYQLPVRQEDSTKDTSSEQSAADDVGSLAPFPTVRLDSRAAAPLPAASEAALTNQLDPTDLVTRDMLDDLSSSESRTFMLDSIEKLVQSSAASPPTETSARLPLGVASTEEWSALAVSSAHSGDLSMLTRTMSLMRSAGHHAPLSLYNDVLDVFATQGQVARCQEWLQQMSEAGLVPDEHTHHSLAKAYATTGQFLPAIELLNTLEVAGSPASMATYTLVITHLISAPTPVSALAWNVFYHMRLHAHPIPDAPLYALMIRACARGVPQPHDVDLSTATPISDAGRALDLFREMTTRYSVRPNAEVYNALILACARRKDFYLEAFRLLREMVELETSRSPDDRETPRFAPDRYTFNALLQGCARNRDLARARWVLAEMIRTTLPLFDEGVRAGLGRGETVELWGKRPDEETMCHVFHAYASYVPPVKRLVHLSTASPTTSAITVEEETSTIPNVEKNTSNDVVSTAANTTIAQSAVGGEEDTPEEAAHIFSALVPQTSSDLISESRSLFARVLADQPSPSTLTEGPLGAVNPGVRLVNAYLTVLAAHLPAGQRAEILRLTLHEEVGERLEQGLFRRLGVGANEHSYRIILESLSETDDVSPTTVAEVWERFEPFIASHNTSTELTTGGTHSEPLDAAQITKCWSAYIHYLAKTSRLDEAMAALRRFTTLYPPGLPPTVAKGSNARRARKKLEQAQLNDPSVEKVDLTPLPVPRRALLALSPHPLASRQDNEEKEDEEGMKGRPTLGFLDVQLLHHRLVRFGRAKDLAYLSWVLHRYAAARRRA